jgi:hypothetical protein
VSRCQGYGLYDSESESEQGDIFFSPTSASPPSPRGSPLRIETPEPSQPASPSSAQMSQTTPPGNPAAGAAAAGSTKKHIQKPDDFTDSKDWEKFNRQAFVYMTEYEGDFPTDGSQICFLFSFFKEGLPEKFTANYIDKIINQTTNPKDWGTIVDFAETHSQTRIGNPTQKTRLPF